ncbi:MAG: PhoH family protein [Oscillospiraceae bacterium]|nr:PhoH family protein [Oscillospiraceae bacterium]
MKKTVMVNNLQSMAEVLGSLNGNVSGLERQLDVVVEPGAQGIEVSGADESKVNSAVVVLQKLLDLSEHGHDVSGQTVRYLSNQADSGEYANVLAYAPDVLCVTAKGRPIRPKTNGQSNYVKAIAGREITFGIGPAGTGKTFLAVAMAVQAFRDGQYSRIILTRPAVEAGEKLGFLPGDLQTKVDPYMRPLYDAMLELMGAETFHNNLEKGLIEVSPLAYMRGRTLDSSFIILDEAQNTTQEQMKMFLTRIGFHSKAVVTGDVTQVDLPEDKKSGLKEIPKILGKVEGIAFVELTTEDVVRNDLVQRIVRAYELFDRGRSR